MPLTLNFLYLPSPFIRNLSTGEHGRIHNIPKSRNKYIIMPKMVYFINRSQRLMRFLIPSKRIKLLEFSKINIYAYHVR